MTEGQNALHHCKKHLGFSSLRLALSSVFESAPDDRNTNRIDHTVHDCMMSAFSCMFFQEPSLVQYQRSMEEKQHRNNLETMFGVSTLPEDTQLRRVVDSVPSETMRPFFKECFSRLQRGKHLTQYQLLANHYLCSIDGTKYHSSKSIDCDSCLTCEHQNDKTGTSTTTYSHQVLQAAIMHPDIKQVIPLMPEEISNSDGTTKQDCEINAFKRFIPSIKKDHPRLKLIIVGDGLYSKQAVIEPVTENGMSYIFSAKPNDHKYLFEWVSAFDSIDTFEFQDEKGRTHVYQWVNDVPLHAKEDSINVNFFSCKIYATDKNSKVNFTGTWVTNISIDSKNIQKLVSGARCRWKIENECFNTLKNQGYSITHNYGHGEKNLCLNFYLLTLLAFFFHQIFELTDKAYQNVRQKYGSKRNMWEKLRAVIFYFILDSWEMLLDFTLDSTRYFNPRLAPP